MALARCASSLSRVSARDIARYGVTQAQFAVLEALYHRGPMALCSIGEKLLVTSGNITFVADQLEKSGLLRRQRSRDDRRVIVASLTARGETLIGKHFPAHAECIRNAAQHLSLKDQGELARLLKRLGRAVQAASEAAD